MSLKWLVSLPSPPPTPDDARSAGTMGWAAFEQECLRAEEDRARRKIERKKKSLDPDEEQYRIATARRKRELRKARKHGTI